MASQNPNPTKQIESNTTNFTNRIHTYIFTPQILLNDSILIIFSYSLLDTNFNIKLEILDT